MNRHLSMIVAGLLLGLIAVVPLSAQSGSSSDSLGKAQINRIINDVFTVEDIRKEKPRVHPSNEGEVIGQYHALRTAEQSRAELKFEDGSVARVGSDAFFSFASNSRDVQMGKGTALFQVPKNSEETNVQTATATASLTGTTVMVNQQPDRHVKTAVIEGSVDVSMPDRAGESRTLQAGQMIVMPTDAERLPEPVDVDLQELVSTSGLINDFDEEDEENGSQEDDETSTETDESDETEETTDESTDRASETDQASESQEDASNGEQEQSSSLNVAQMSEGIEQQQEEIESGELEETNMVIDGEGTEVTLEDEEDLETETSTDDNKDAIEQKSDDQTTLALDGTKEVYFGTDNDQDPPTADGLEGEISTPSSSTDGGPSPGDEDQTLLEAALTFLNGGVETALFTPDVIEVDDEPSIQTTDTVKDVAFYAQENVDFNIDNLVIDSQSDVASIGVGAGADDSQLTLPDLEIQNSIRFGAITVGDGSELLFGNVQAPGSFVTGFSRDDLSVASGSNVSAGSLNFNTLTGALTLDDNIVEAQQISLQGFSPQTTITALNGSEVRTLDPASSVTFTGFGGSLSIQNSTLGYYDASANAYDPTNGAIHLSSVSTENPGSLDITGSDLKAGEILLALGGGDASIQDSKLLARNGSVSPALSVQGNLTTDNALLESATRLSLTSPATDGQSLSINNQTDLRTLSIDYPVSLASQGGDISIQNSTLGYFDASADAYDPTAGGVNIASVNTDNPGSLDIAGSVLKAGGVSYNVGGGDVSIQDSTLSAKGGGSPPLSGQGDLTADNSTFVSGGDLGLSSSTTSGQSFSITNSTELKTLAAGGAISVVSDGGDMKVVKSRVGYEDQGSFSTAGGIVMLDSSNPDASATVNITHDGSFPTGTNWGPADVDLMAETIKARANGPNGELLIDGSFMAASAGLQLYARGSDGTVRFTGDSRIDLGGTAGAALAGNTVRVDNGVEVTVSGIDFPPEVYANNYFYGSAEHSAPLECADGSQCGKFVDPSGTKISILEDALGNSPPFQ